MKNKKYILVFSIIAIILLFTIFIMKTNNKSITTSNTTLSNVKIGWGIKRNNNHQQPDLGNKNKQLIDENEDIAIGNSDKPYVYLTFDEGYEAGYTSKILDTLKENNVKATFFITGHYLNSATDLVKRMIDEGHIVGNHTVNRKSMPELTEEQLRKEIMDLHQAIYEKFEYEMKYTRPPKGEFSEKTLKYTNRLGYKTVMWSFAYEDWNEDKQPDELLSKEKILKNLHNGEIILLHGNSKTNTNILDTIIKETKSMGYEFKSLNEFEK